MQDDKAIVIYTQITSMMEDLQVAPRTQHIILDQAWHNLLNLTAAQGVFFIQHICSIQLFRVFSQLLNAPPRSHNKGGYAPDFEDSLSTHSIHTTTSHLTHITTTS